ncbi:trypsin-like serine protease [Streptomyces sp. TRM49041]|uniref:trypsin-like serine protease n=1 Tax=Streptomyces sp. TRM49041 TaxID=2603216 RepID=UPI0021CC5226|nr:trypsin-like serine protease [Streptomyces sp. TRM49041]
MTSAQRRARTALPAAAAALALGGALLGAAPAQASDTSPLPGDRSVRELPTPSQDELRARVDGVRTVLKEGGARKDDTREGDAPENGTSQDADGTGTGAAPDSSPSTVDPKIIGGQDATIAEAPWMVQLYYYDAASDTGFFCGGSLVAPNKVLTAAHCVDGTDWALNGAVIGGTEKLFTSGEGTLVGVARQWVNPDYDDAAINGDVAVLTLNSPLPYRTLQVTTAADTLSYKAGTPATVYGWGRVSSTSQDGADTLQKATVPMRADSSCSTYYGSDFVAGNMVCAGNPASGQDSGTVSPCNGDSGGPLVVNGRIAGVVSWGVVDCVESGAYSVYAKTSTYVGRINPRIDDTDLNFDGRADLLARTTGGELFEYYSRGTSVGGRVSIGDWSGTNLIRQVDLQRDNYVEYMIRTTAGDLWWVHPDYDTGSWQETRIGGGWGVMKSITVPGDLTGDGNADLLAVDASGVMWHYAGRGDGTFNNRLRVGSGWGVLTVTGKGDYTGDGKVDLLARDTSGRLYVYPGRGSSTAPFGTRTYVGRGWNYTAYAATGDVSGDGRADLLARDKDGVLWFYAGRSSATAPFSARVRIGSGWNAFDVFG